MDKINFDAPAFAKTEPVTEQEISSVKAPTEVSQTEGEVKEPATLPAEGTVEQEVPYSRFSTVSRRAREAEQRAQEAEAALEELQRERATRPEVTRETSREPEQFTGGLPSYWVKLYGDSPQSREAYGYELVRQEQIEERAERRAVEAYRNEGQAERRALVANENIIDNRIDDLSDQLGRGLTDSEESALLDIVDEYTPKDEYGNYAGDTIPFTKAWEIYEMKQGAQAQTTRRSRSTATQLTGSKTEGEPSGQEKQKNDNWNPMDWNSYRKRIG